MLLPKHLLQLVFFCPCGGHLKNAAYRCMGRGGLNPYLGGV